MTVILVPMVSPDQWGHVALHFRHLDLRNIMLPLVMQLASHETCTNGVIWPKIMLHFILIILTWGMHSMPLWMLLVSCDADTSANVITDQKSHMSPHFDHLDLRKTMVPLMTVSHDADAFTSGITWTKSHVAPHFDYQDFRNAVVPLMIPSGIHDADTGTSGITWTRKVMLHLILIIFT